MSDGYDPSLDQDHGQDHGHYDDPATHDDGQSIHAHQDDLSYQSHDSDTTGHDSGYHTGYDSDYDHQVLVLDEVVEVHDLHTVEIDHDGRLELVEYDNIHYEHVQGLVEIDDLGQHSTDVDYGHDGTTPLGNDQQHADSTDPQPQHDQSQNTNPTNQGHYGPPAPSDASPYANN